MRAKIVIPGIGAIIGGGILLMVLWSAGVLRPLDALGGSIISAVSGNLYRGGNTINTTAQTLFCSTQSDSGSLEKRLEEASARVASLEFAQQENETLKKQLSYVQSQKKSITSAAVIGRVNTVGRKGIVIDKGEENGIHKGYAVIAGEGTLIGTVSETHPTTAIVLFLSDAQSKVLASVSGQEKLNGVAEGQFGLGIELHFIPITEKINENDLVTTAPGNEFIPPGLLIGALSNIKSKPSDLFQSAQISPLIHYDAITFVSVLVP